MAGGFRLASSFRKVGLCNNPVPLITIWLDSGKEHDIIQTRLLGSPFREIPKLLLDVHLVCPVDDSITLFGAAFLAWTRMKCWMSTCVGVIPTCILSRIAASGMGLLTRRGNRPLAAWCRVK